MSEDSSNLVVPVVLWGKEPPTHCVSSIYLFTDKKAIATGCHDGQIILWNMDPASFKMIPYCMLVGHTAPIVCLERATIKHGGNTYLVSSTENGEMCTWDIDEGRCEESVKMHYVHSRIQAYQAAGYDDVVLFCNGYYPEILMMNPRTLDIIYTLASKMNPDWISAVHMLRPPRRQDDVVLGLTVGGTVKVWTILANEQKTSEPLYENESKQIRCLQAISLTCCPYNPRTVLVVAAKFWQIYDAGDFSLLCSEVARRGERWLGGSFLANDKVIGWSDVGLAYIYGLPNNCNVDSKEFHSQASDLDSPVVLRVLGIVKDKPLACPPAFLYHMSRNSEGEERKYLIRGDAEGSVCIWAIANEIPNTGNAEEVLPFMTTSLSEAWESLNPHPPGVLDHLELDVAERLGGENPPRLTASLYLALQGRLVCGREDGSILIVPATQCVLLQLLHGKHHLSTAGLPSQQTLLGHTGRVNCLLYPHHHDPRYELAHLLSGGVDFSVCLWDLYTGSMLHRFSPHAGEILQLHITPSGCSPRVLQCVCSVASDHSVALLGLRERRCVLLASRHLFPVTSIKWRPLDDFMVVSCFDGTVYVWQMETGHLDRVVQGINAEEIVAACDEHSQINTDTGESGLANPAVHFFRGLRHRNLAAIRHAAQRGLHHLQAMHHHQQQGQQDHQESRAAPMLIQSLRTNPKDSDSHLLFFHVEALIVQLLTEEYSTVTPGTLEAAGLIHPTEYQKVLALTQSASPDAQRKIAGLLARVKEGAESMQHKIQAKAESVGLKHGHGEESGKKDESWKPRSLNLVESSLTLEIAQLLLSLLHAWGLDPDLDRVCENKLGLLRPLRPASFGLLSKAGYMSLQLPMAHEKPPASTLPVRPACALTLLRTAGSRGIKAYPELLNLQQEVSAFTPRIHWEVSRLLTTNHLLAVVAMSNTLMSMSQVTFTQEGMLTWKDHRGTFGEEGTQSAVKQGWSLLATLHCVLLPDLTARAGAMGFKRPLVNALARRWQDQCLEVRQAAQAMLLAELNRIGAKGRKELVDEWCQYLPTFPDHPEAVHQHESDDEEDDTESSDGVRKSAGEETKRRQYTSIILMGVIGSEFGQDVEQRRKSIDGGFSLNSSSARNTGRALMHLLLAPATSKLPAHTPLRRAAVDLLGRGFTVWEPHLDHSKVMLAMLELCCDADRLLPSMTYALPLTPAADSCRTARHALGLIAGARPRALVTTLAREVARYNTMQQNAQSLQLNLQASTLHRAKPEILRVIAELIEKTQGDIQDLLVEVMDIVLHCVEPGHLKMKGLGEVFPAITRFHMVAHCPSTRRIAVGTKQGSLAMYELRANNKYQTIPAHGTGVTACSFSPDGRLLASYAMGENRLSFWQTSTGMFGLGTAQTRCTKTYSTPSVSEMVRLNPPKSPRLIWSSNKVVSLVLPDGTEHKFNV